MEVTELILRPAGMFSNVNEVVQQLYLAERSGYQFIIDWSASCYRSSQRKTDPWNYYFEDCFPDVNSGSKSLRQIPFGTPVACSKNNIITPREIDGNCVPLLLPKNRELPHRFIKSNINLKKALKDRISKLVSVNFSERTIGLHIRGSGRRDGGSSQQRSQNNGKYGIPFKRYFKHVDAYLLKHPEAKIFICSDSLLVIRKVMLRYGEKVITYQATRSEFGEMHVAGQPENSGSTFPKYKLGEDVIIETYMLSKTNYFIHGNSNVVNFVLCKNPHLPNQYIYCD